MSEAPREEEELEEEAEDVQETPAPPVSQGKTWYPYITKSQFEKFLSRLEGRIPEEIDRDYVRAIIRTPSMIYRFLRGIEAMRLIDREQRPTQKLERMVNRGLRKFAIAEVLQDLYADLVQQWRESSESMSDDDMIDFFRARTGMGRDSASKMKMFFKYLLTEADFGQPSAEAEEAFRRAPAQQPAPPPAPVAAAPPPQQQRLHEPAAGQRDAGHGHQAPPVPGPQAALPQHAPEQGQERRPQRDGGRDNRPGQQQQQQRQPQQQQRQPQQQQQRQPQQAQQQAQQQESSEPIFGDRSSRGLNEVQRAYLQTLQSVLRVNIDGDWDEDMVRSVFDRLERLFDRIRRG